MSILNNIVFLPTSKQVRIPGHVVTTDALQRLCITHVHTKKIQIIFKFYHTYTQQTKATHKDRDVESSIDIPTLALITLCTKYTPGNILVSQSDETNSKILPNKF